MKMMTCRKSKTMLNRFFAFVAVLAMALLSWLLVFAFGVNVRAEQSEQDEGVTYADNTQHDSIFGVDHANATKIATAAEFDSLSSGTYCLEEDIQINQVKEFYDDEQINFCLHGHSLSIGYGSIFRVCSGADISIYDCGGTGTLSSKLGNIVQSGKLNLYGGTITGGNNGHAVSVFSNSPVMGEFNMYGGAIKNNIGGQAPGVEIGAKGMFNMYGGTISNNSTTHSSGGAGVYLYNYDSEFHMFGGTITGNVADCTRASASSKKAYYNGAGVNFKTGKFTIEGDVDISGNIKKDGDTQVLSNVYFEAGCKLEISGRLGANAQIGVTAPDGAFTTGYSVKGHRDDPSKYFEYDGGIDSDKKIGYDATGKEAAILDSNDSGTYKMESAEVIAAAAAMVGDTKVTFTVKVTLVNTVDNTKKDTTTDIKEVTLAQPLHGGNNNVSFDYTYGEETRRLSYVVVPAKLRVNVVWACEGGVSNGIRSFKRGYDGSDVISAVSASFTGYNGNEKIITGSTTSSDIIARDVEGNVLESTAAVGVYKFYLAPSVDYDYDYDNCTVEVDTDEPVDNGYDKMTKAEVVGLVGNPIVGEKKITVRLKVTLKNTKTEVITVKNNVTYSVALDTPLTAGDNTINFEYKYIDAKKDVQTESLTVKVTAAKKQVTVRWYFNGSLVTNNALKHVYDGVDVADKIVARYDGVDGTKQNIDGASASMLKKDKDGKPVTSLNDVGVYTLSLADSADYVFDNNLFTYTVVENLGEISDLTYEKDGIYMGVSSSEPFENGTELKVEKITGIDPNVVNGEINTAYNVKFVKGGVDVVNNGMFTVNVLVPNELRDKTYKIYSFGGGVATELAHTPNGNYATFETGELDCLLFVEIKDAPPIDPIDPDDPDDPDDPNDPDDPKDPDNNGDEHVGITIDDSGLTWLWVFLAIVGACVIIGIAVLIAKAKSKKNSDKK